MISCVCHMKLIVTFLVSVFVLFGRQYKFSHSAKINERLKGKEMAHFRHTKFSTVSRGFPSLTPFIFLLPPQDVIITTNMLLVTYLQYHSRFMCKNKTVFLLSCKSKKGRLISEPLPLVEEVYISHSVSIPVSTLMPVTLSGLMCLLIAWIQASQRT